MMRQSQFSGCISMVVVLGLGLGLAMTTPSTTRSGTILYVDDDAPPGGDGQSWETAFHYLQDALAAAQPGSGVEEIRVGQGAYRPDQDEAGNVTPGDREAAFTLAGGVVHLGGYAGYGATDPDARDVELYETILTGDLNGDDEPDFVNYEDNSFHVTPVSYTHLTLPTN